jgi:Rieske Fe-S protein
MSRFKNRRWLVIPTSIIDDINFEQVLEPNKESLRKSIDESLTFVKYEVVVVDEDIIEKFTDPMTNEQKTSKTLAGVYGRPDVYSKDYTEYNHEDILALLNTEAWAKNEIEE